MRIFLYECISAGGLGADVPDSLRREGWAMLSAIADDFMRMPDVTVATLLDDRLTRSLGHDCTRIAWPDEPACFRDVAARCDWTLVIAPEFDDLLRRRCQIVLDVGGRMLGSAPAAIGLAGDKLATAAFWHARGVPHPRTDLIDPVEFARFGPPWIVKPRHGAGSQATYAVRNHEEKSSLWFAARRDWPDGDLIVQQYVPGEAASVAVLMGPAQTLPLRPARQHLSNDGRCRYTGGSLPLPTSLAERAVHLAQNAVAGLPGLLGYVGVDLVLGLAADASEDYAIEINPRLTTSYIGLRRSCRQNLAAAMLRCVRGETIEPLHWNDAEIHFSVDTVLDGS